MAWQAQDALGVIFLAPSASVPNPLSLWGLISADSPDNFQKGVPASTVGGAFEGYKLALTVQPGRLDVGLSNQDDGGTGRPPILSDWKKAIGIVKRVCQQLCGENNPIRVSLVSNCVQIARDAADATRLFAEAAHLSDIPAHAADLGFSLNVRKKTGHSGWELNRLCRWGTGQFQLLTFMVGPGGMQIPQVQVSNDIASMVVDVNTVPRGTLPLGSKQAKDAFDAIESEIIDIISRGYDALLDA